jgi:hypothetical protein
VVYRNPSEQVLCVCVCVGMTHVVHLVVFGLTVDHDIIYESVLNWST